MSTNLAIYLYGSKARGDYTKTSDTDVLVVAQNQTSLKHVCNFIPSALQPANINFYSWDEFSHMAKYGSLFLHHIKLEGKSIYTDDIAKKSLNKIFSDLKSYQRAREDLKSFQNVIKETESSLKENNLLVFDLATLATVIRHCSILGCWLLKNPCFKRIDPVFHVLKECDINSFKLKDYESLYNYKLYIDKKIEKRDLKITDFSKMNWVNCSTEIVDAVKEIANG